MTRPRKPRPPAPPKPPPPPGSLTCPACGYVGPAERHRIEDGGDLCPECAR